MVRTFWTKSKNVILTFNIRRCKNKEEKFYFLHLFAQISFAVKTTYTNHPRQKGSGKRVSFNT